LELFENITGVLNFLRQCI